MGRQKATGSRASSTGALGGGCRSPRTVAPALADAATHAAVLAERAFTRALGGTCHSPVAALARIEGGEIAFSGEIFSADGQERVGSATRFPVGDLDAPAALARRMMADAPEAIRILFEAR